MYSVNGAWSGWTGWSGCDVTCGDGTIARDRKCDNPAPAYGGHDCLGDGHETQVCKLSECPSNKIILF